MWVGPAGVILVDRWLWLTDVSHRDHRPGTGGWYDSEQGKVTIAAIFGVLVLHSLLMACYVCRLSSAAASVST